MPANPMAPRKTTRRQPLDRHGLASTDPLAEGLATTVELFREQLRADLVRS